MTHAGGTRPSITEKARELIDDALSIATADLEDIARAAGVGHDDLRAWRNGRRHPSAEDLGRLAETLELRGGKLRALARSLKKETQG